ncbi:MAG: hypothetical protein CMB99_10100 [Flavobacteriaceae bacterium]|nr:hypothetical protein [Flavobacteriaceae bacterium]|tara:strand:- start:320290 stop:321156 length:867 start_codon:yes stop_codon:yes gene_type:complete
MRKPPSILIVLFYFTNTFGHNSRLCELHIADHPLLNEDYSKVTSLTNLQFDFSSMHFEDGFLWLLLLSFFLFSLINIWYLAQYKRKLKRYHRLKFVEIREKERKQIARTLHDEVVGDLVGLQQKLTQNQSYKTTEELNKLRENLRSLSHNLSSVSFRDLSFAKQVLNLISDYTENHRAIELMGLTEIDWPTVNEAIKRTLYLCLRESLQNAQKHSEASIMTIRFQEQKNTLILMVSDNGVGFANNNEIRGIGLQNMKERLEEIHGKLTIDSCSNKGTNIIFEIPRYEN